MNWHVYPRLYGWGIRKHGSGRTLAEWRQRAQAVAEARRQAKKTNGVVYVHNGSGVVINRYPRHVA